MTKIELLANAREYHQANIDKLCEAYQIINGSTSSTKKYCYPDILDSIRKELGLEVLAEKKYADLIKHMLNEQISDVQEANERKVAKLREEEMDDLIACIKHY